MTTRSDVTRQMITDEVLAQIIAEYERLGRIPPGTAHADGRERLWLDELLLTNGVAMAQEIIRLRAQVACIRGNVPLWLEIAEKEGRIAELRARALRQQCMDIEE